MYTYIYLNFTVEYLNSLIWTWLLRICAYLISGPEWVSCHSKDQGEYARRSKAIWKGRSTRSSRLLYAVTWPSPIPTLPFELALLAPCRTCDMALVWGWPPPHPQLLRTCQSSVMRAMCECRNVVTVSAQWQFATQLWWCDSVCGGVMMGRWVLTDSWGTGISALNSVLIKWIKTQNSGDGVLSYSGIWHD